MFKNTHWDWMMPHNSENLNRSATRSYGFLGHMLHFKQPSKVAFEEEFGRINSSNVPFYCVNTKKWKPVSMTYLKDNLIIYATAKNLSTVEIHEVSNTDSKSK